ncbi:maleylpyruvate isomerase N-terminal domain-containing protein [Nocardioides sp. MAHUQ-72]|uniref:maleylpyruvate isomerase N-terminal domain-containing protein n=1 Tax=unclassified Nocardioides TaxID=2615069 RepID=UPI00362455A1
MAKLEFADYLRHIRDESRRFRDVLASCPASARVPSCPDWESSDLLWHLAEVQRFWAEVVRTRPAAPGEDDDGPARPDTHEGLLAAFDEHSAALVGELEAADPAETAWTWATEQSVGFILRRQAHEALIHRLDAELTAGTVTPLDRELAADGVLECLDVMFGSSPPWGEFAPLPHHVRVDVTDTGESVWVQIGRFTGTDPQSEVHHDEDDVRVVDDPGTEPDAVVDGPAGALDAWLWRRGDDSEIRVHGDKAVYDHFRLAVNHPIT